MEKIYLETQTESFETQKVKERIANLKKQDKFYKSIFSSEKIPLTLTFNDVLMVPQYGEIESRYFFPFTQISMQHQFFLL